MHKRAEVTKRVQHTCWRANISVWGMRFSELLCGRLQDIKFKLLMCKRSHFPRFSPRKCFGGDPKGPNNRNTKNLHVAITTIICISSYVVCRKASQPLHSMCILATSRSMKYSIRRVLVSASGRILCVTQNHLWIAGTAQSRAHMAQASSFLDSIYFGWGGSRRQHSPLIRENSC